ncbi:MAG TPA: hypothetical protein IGS53_14685 [Leptolyngbyaceae cyanobacterium M33_DOE_097]|uniref:Uncharacterized protein n=1 Tax=Oscillatoriales cyanobacterium SpSt-418 TaxID=2282169 RepID=A0A7C3PKU3_9CYAN|nr:hypothetical protein [Leptolyngbyaceae cyanobacterium M33_DOE_097]
MRSLLSSFRGLPFDPTLPRPYYLVEPFHRFRFIVLYMLATGIGWFLVGTAMRPLEASEIPTFLQSSSLFGAFVGGIIAGMMVGALQWLVLRRVMPDWLWILTNVAGYAVTMTAIQAWQRWLQTIGVQRFATTPPWAFLLLSILVTMVCTLWLGLLQWLLIRNYARPSWGWLLTPAIAIAIASSLVGIHQFLAQAGVRVTLQVGVLAAGVLGLTQAIAFCVLHQRASDRPAIRDLALRNAPFITEPRQIRRMTRRLLNQIHRNWKGDVMCEQAVPYLVGVTASGAIAAYEPERPVSAAYLEHTPLPEMLTPSPPNAALPALARLQVTFLPSGQVTVYSWQGASLLDLAWKFLLAVIVLSIVTGSLRYTMPFLGQ